MSSPVAFVSNAVSFTSAFFGTKKVPTFQADPSKVKFHVRAEEEEAAPAPKKAAKAFTVPSLNLSLPTPIFGGSTGGLLNAAITESYYTITWTGKKESIFELPTGGAAIMREGDNLLKLSRKEQCIALGTQLKNKFKIVDYKVYRVFPNGETQFVHPADGVFPEKVNPGRSQVNTNARPIGKNPEPATVKFSGVATFNAK